MAKPFLNWWCMKKPNINKISKIVSILEDKREVLAGILEAEKERFDKMPEYKQDCESGYKLQEEHNYLEAALDSLEEVINNLSDSIAED